MIKMIDFMVDQYLFLIRMFSSLARKKDIKKWGKEKAKPVGETRERNHRNIQQRQRITRVSQITPVFSYEETER